MDIRRRMLFKKKAGSGGGSITGGSYTVNLNSQWEATTAVPNPDSTLYDGVYRSSSNYNVDSGVAIMYITIKDCSSFKMYIRSYAESSWDYVMVSQLDKTINGNTSYSNTTMVKAHTRGNQQSGTALSNYTLVEFTGITSGEHTITVVYRKDDSGHSGDDRGYVLIEKMQAGSGDSGGDDVIPEPIIDIDNYLTIEARENGLTASLSNNACEYCVDGDGNWKSLVADTATESINAGHTLSFRGELTPNSSNGIGTFTVNKNFNLKGNCMSMLFGDNAANNYSLSGKNYAFYKLFDNCTNIVNVSKNFLPATTLASYCYRNMFYGCTNLTSVPNLPATTLASYCYASMFYSTKLIIAPELPATTLASYCYNAMFDNCACLVNAPELPAMTLAKYCYVSMFRNCTSLITAPSILPATTLVDYCYYNMFVGCASLYVAPVLPATTLKTYCYRAMFSNCSKINHIEMFATDISANSCLYNWVNGVASTGTFVKNPAMTSLPTGNSGVPNGWTFIDKSMNINNYLTIEALEDGLTASLSVNACEYCVDGDGNWKSLTADTTTEPINAGQTLSFKALLQPKDALSYGIGTFTISKKCNLKGNCMSMLFGDIAEYNYSLDNLSRPFYELFYNCNTIQTVSSNFLPATTLSGQCYYHMFSGCTSLTTAPELPATTLKEYCYQRMFESCTSLTTAPALPATTLKEYCYNYMFFGCSKLNYIKMLATNISASSCLEFWLYKVASKGTFVKSPDMSSLPTGTHGIPSGWTVVNDGEEPIDIDNYLTIEALEDGLTASLSVNACEYCVDGDGDWKTLAAGTATEAINTGQTLSFRGELTPTSSNGIGKFTISKKCNLKGNCMSMLFGDNAANNYSLSDKDHAFYLLFRNCTNIINVSSNFLPATSMSDSCYYLMFGGCTSLTTAPELPSTTLANQCYSLMFSGCTNLTTAPSLPATTLASNCYKDMFDGCTSLTIAPELPATTLADYCYRRMFYGCTRLTTAPELPATTLTTYCYKDMFSGCTSLITAPELPATTLALDCYSNMFYGCTNLTTAPSILPATTLANYCYEFMFQYCSNLTTAPELPATTLTRECYYHMFSGCSKLNYIKMLATDVSAYNCLYDWVVGVASTGTFVKNPAMTTLPTGVHGIPNGWTVVNDGEESGGNLITFTINGTEYQAEEGMTWGKWVDSEYNVNNYVYDEHGIYWDNGGPSALMLFNSSYGVVGISEIILPNGTYIFSD